MDSSFGVLSLQKITLADADEDYEFVLAPREVQSCGPAQDDSSEINRI